ncbi:MAG TPA: bifunctional diguanylate cyclase/phosphodiesterase [Acidimicrobiia bacterium]|nr:bifunctional diguanylate cyclase/phosphodiesterase [Acidimicrobiia bacterium]
MLAATHMVIPSVGVVLGGVTLLAVVVRALVSFRQINTLALYDRLTGLPNRALVIDRLDRLLARNRRNGTRAAALFIDLDGFKHVNDTFGHDAGDELLRSVAARLATAVREADTVGRMGGDEFVVLIDGGARQATPTRVADRLLDAMRRPFELDLAPSPVVGTTSIGIAEGDRPTPGDLLRDADLALYRAKAMGKDCYERFGAEIEAQARREYELERDLGSALAKNEFCLVYQPIYNLADLSLVSVEALLRWQHPTLGLIGPDALIPILEANERIVDVGRWVLRESCRQMKEWHDRGIRLSLSVNVSARQLDHEEIVDDVTEALAVTGFAPQHLMLEITETTLMNDPEMTTRRLRSLKELGVLIAIDDFGTGYSSLAYLQQFPVDCIKIDRIFTEAITRQDGSIAMLHALVHLGKDLGLTTVAEGVETLDQLDHLKGEHVNEVQGFLLSHPLTAEALEETLLHRFLRAPASQDS